jgi:hypothetical protein
MRGLFDRGISPIVVKVALVSMDVRGAGPRVLQVRGLASAVLEATWPEPHTTGGPAMPDVIASIAPDEVRLWVALDVHKFSIVAAVLPPEGGGPECSGLRRLSGDPPVHRQARRS